VAGRVLTLRKPNRATLVRQMLPDRELVPVTETVKRWPGKETSELKLRLKLPTITVIFLTQTCIVSFSAATPFLRSRRKRCASPRTMRTNEQSS